MITFLLPPGSESVESKALFLEEAGLEYEGRAKFDTRKGGSSTRRRFAPSTPNGKAARNCRFGGGPGGARSSGFRLQLRSCSTLATRLADSSEHQPIVRSCCHGLMFVASGNRARTRGKPCTSSAFAPEPLPYCR